MNGRQCYAVANGGSCVAGPDAGRVRNGAPVLGDAVMGPDGWLECASAIRMTGIAGVGVKAGFLTKLPRGGADSISISPASRSVSRCRLAITRLAALMLSVVCQSSLRGVVRAVGVYPLPRFDNGGWVKGAAFGWCHTASLLLHH